MAAFIPATARDEAARRYAAIGERWLTEFGVTLIKSRRSLSGRANVRTGQIAAPWPTTTRRRLYILAHEIGHIALRHKGSRPVYVQEFEAELFAHGLMRRDGLAVPKVMTERAKRYVTAKIKRAYLHSAEWIDPDIAAWAGTGVRGINWCTPPEKQRHFYDASRRRVAAALARTV